ncbi:hypothetical protein ACIRL2_31135 [Embleya sp. NPDC127516]|uniref:hypothetical protein n=1 Tax=Embleya sp. NPDC127516 TaxID=3363990 RepID=UPI0038225338
MALVSLPGPQRLARPGKIAPSAPAGRGTTTHRPHHGDEAMPQRDWKLREYTYDPDLLTAHYELPDGSYESETLAIPPGTLPALVQAVLAHADQNERTHILRAEVKRNDEAMAARYRAMPVPDWLPAAYREGHTLR